MVKDYVSQWNNGLNLWSKIMLANGIIDENEYKKYLKE